MVHAPSSLVFELAPDARSVSGAYGYAPGAYGGGKTDGAVFSATCESASTRAVLFRQRLDPVNNPDHRRLQTFREEIPCSGGQLRLDIDPGPAGNTSWDWTVWSAIDIE